jgi:type I restriction enzyme S subunit
MSLWPQIEIGEVADVFDGPHATPKTVDSGPIFLGIGALQRGRLNLSETRHVTTEDFRAWTRRVKPQHGDVVFSYETRIGEAAIIPRGLECCLGRRMGLVRADRKRLDPRFFLYTYLSPAFQEFLRSRTITGATVDRIALTEFPTFRIPLPPLTVQQATAAILGALDEKIDHSWRMNETLEEMARAIFEHRAVAEAWEERPLGDFVTIFDGPHATPKLASAGPIFLGISNLNSGVLDLAELNHVTDEDFTTWTRRVTPQHGDLVFSYETRLGQAALIPEGFRCCLGRRMGLLRPKQHLVSSVVLLRAYLSPHFQEVIRRHTISGATVDRIPLREMPFFPIVLPAPAEMAEISAQLQPLRDKLDANLRENETLQSLRDLLLPRLMSGEVCVREAEAVMADVA